VLSINQQTLNDLVKLLSEFVERKPGTLSGINRSNPQIVHYYSNIIRYWNQLNFILSKTLRSLDGGNDGLNIDPSYLLYAAYRIRYEQALPDQVLNELNLKKEQIFLLNRIKSFSWNIALKGKSKIERLSIEQAIPSFFIERLLKVMKIEEIRKNVEFMNNIDEKGDFTFQILSTKEQSNIIKDLKSENIPVHPDPHISHLYISQNKYKKKILSNNWYHDGKIIFQDKSSAAVADILSLDQSDFYWDACAAPGIKSIVISRASEDNFKMIGGDFDFNRLYQSRTLMIRHHVVNVNLCQMDSILPPFRFKNFFDKILIDAPCSGSGSFRNNPELKWKQSKYYLKTTTILQEKLLATAIKYLKPDGILVYATCSLYPEEGELQLIRYADDLVPMSLPDWFSKSYKINGSYLRGTGRLFPAVHHSQGFFIGKFKKKAA
jgi:16S rRNA (cytosine967-C5)-methyltransferase